ncbi:MAG TPA: deaminase [Streptosporangiaceae bacterium]|nr:deaminase [Streptosporangiaceae bacterium]
MTEPHCGATRIPGEVEADRYWLDQAIDLSRKCPVSEFAFSVGAILVSVTGEVLATGYSRETDPKDHAEEVALRRASGTDLAKATLYSSLEPCLGRASRPVSCSELIAASGLQRVVIAWLEPPKFVPHGGAMWLAARDIAVIQLADLAPAARAVNGHLLR